jgi:hypothetical protein
MQMLGTRMKAKTVEMMEDVVEITKKTRRTQKRTKTYAPLISIMYPVILTMFCMPGGSQVIIS